MSTATDVYPLAGVPARAVRRKGLRAFVRDTALITHRHLLRTWRTPQIMILSAVTPVMFVLLFRYVFGGSIHVPGYPSYVDYLIPGILVQTVLFGGSSTTVGLADDLSKGITDRFRSLPTHRAAILAARTFAGLPQIAAGLAIALLFGYACSWTFALLALCVRHAETAQLAAFMITFPLVFAASTFTSTATMPSWLQTFADHQPVTRVVDALRALTEGSGWAGRPTLYALAWSLGIVIVAATLATWRFRRA
jgi:ABC-type multidrug transport system permease subunit